MSTTWIGTWKVEVESPYSETWQRLRRWSGQQRAAYHLTLDVIARGGERIPALQKSKHHPKGLYGRLTQGEGELSADRRLDPKGAPLWIRRAGVAMARNASAAYGDHVRLEAWGARGTSPTRRSGRPGWPRSRRRSRNR